MLTCPHCGQVNEDTAQNCIGCRRGLSAGENGAVPVCPRCGKRFEAGIRFCDVDGAELVPDTGEGPRPHARGKTPNPAITADARRALKGRWWHAVIVTGLFFLIHVAAQAIPVIGWLISLLISGALAVGYRFFTLALSRRQNAQAMQLFEGFRIYTTALAAHILQLLFILLWALLLIVPGVVAALSYAMTYYIILENRQIAPLDAIRASKRMMVGHRWKLFRLFLRFFGWSLLALLTLGIGFLWLYPYIMVSMGRFYDDVSSGSPLSRG